jgi:heparan-alpha-glucosaminide N-acetyltransferase
MSTSMAIPASAEAPPIAAATRMPRLLSIDVLRGLDVLLMLFVNEMAGVEGTPAWLLHTPPRNDGMTITDVVFPAFLFITGMAIPLALGARIARGQSTGRLWRHVLTRSLSLIVLGVFMVDAEQGASAGVLSPHAWNTLMTVAALLVWQSPGSGDRQERWPLTRIIGVIALVSLAFLYHGTGASGLIQMRPHWWGILGLIGWAYLVAAGSFLVLGRNPVRLLAMAAALYGLFFLDQTGVVPWLVAIRPIISVGQVLGSHAALVVTGTALIAGFLEARERDRSLPAIAQRIVLYGIALIAIGLVLHQFRDVSHVFWINKVMATPAWCLISGGLTAITWAALLLAVDRVGWRRWPPVVTIAGEQPLLIYLLAPLLGSLMALSAPIFGGHNPYEQLGGDLLIGTLRSMVFAWLVVRLAGWLRARGLRLRL